MRGILASPVGSELAIALGAIAIALGFTVLLWHRTGRLLFGSSRSILANVGCALPGFFAGPAAANWLEWQSDSYGPDLVWSFAAGVVGGCVSILVVRLCLHPWMPARQPLPAGERLDDR